MRLELDKLGNNCRAFERVHASCEGEGGLQAGDERLVFHFPFYAECSF